MEIPLEWKMTIQQSFVKGETLAFTTILTTLK